MFTLILPTCQAQSCCNGMRTGAGASGYRGKQYRMGYGWDGEQAVYRAVACGGRMGEVGSPGERSRARGQNAQRDRVHSIWRWAWWDKAGRQPLPIGRGCAANQQQGLQVDVEAIVDVGGRDRNELRHGGRQHLRSDHWRDDGLRPKSLRTATNANQACSILTMPMAGE